MIFAQGRTGSSLLRNLLNQHPRVHCDGEILDTRVSDPFGFVVERADTATTDAYGFKVKVYQLTDAQQREPGAFLRRLDAAGFDIVYLWRRNLLRHALSNAFAERRGRYHDRPTDSEERPRFEVDANEVVGAMTRRLGHRRRELEALDGLAFTEIVYEDDLLDSSRHQGTVDRVVTLLGFEPVSVTTDLARSVTGSLRDRLANYDEVAAAVRRHGFGEHLDDGRYA